MAERPKGPPFNRRFQLYIGPEFDQIYHKDKAKTEKKRRQEEGRHPIEEQRIYTEPEGVLLLIKIDNDFA